MIAKTDFLTPQPSNEALLDNGSDGEIPVSPNKHVVRNCASCLPTPFIHCATCVYWKQFIMQEPASVWPYFHSSDAMTCDNGSTCVVNAHTLKYAFRNSLARLSFMACSCENSPSKARKWHHLNTRNIGCVPAHCARNWRELAM